MNKKTIGFIVTALIVGAMVVLMVKPSTKNTPLNLGETPPDFTLTTLQDETVTLSDLKGKKVMLNFWGSWCGPCKAEMPYMEKYYESLSDEDNIEVIAVNLTTTERRGLDAVAQFVEDYELTFPIPLDESGDVMDNYEVITIPTTYFIGTDGKVAQLVRGPMDETMMKDIIDQVN